MMAEYIDREAVLDAIWPVDPENDGSDGCTVVLKNCIFSSEEIEAMVDDIPAEDVRAVVHARWVEYKRAHYFKCSSWKKPVPYRKAVQINGTREYNFCPYCGAQMDGGAANEH